MTPSKNPPDYLKKDSNIRNFEAWDVSGRLGSIEQEFAQIKSTIEKSDTQQEVWKESVEMYKARGMSTSSLPWADCHGRDAQETWN